MDFFQALINAVVQAITAFPSISRSAHPIRVPESTGWEDQGLAFDAAVRGGTPLLIPVWKSIGRRASPA
jgi:undecaprenyl-diphosphatase